LQEAAVNVVEGRFWVRLISHEALAQYMGFRGETVRSLAEAVDRENMKSHKKETSTRAIVGLLRSGKRDTCQPWTARSIEKCLQAPPGSLFVPKVSHVSRPQRTAA
jgi:hypothetical protein